MGVRSPPCQQKFNGVLAQPDRVPAFEAGSCGFKSLTHHQEKIMKVRKMSSEVRERFEELTKLEKQRDLFGPEKNELQKYRDWNKLRVKKLASLEDRRLDREMDEELS